MTYHKVFIPRSDVYQIGGSQIFKHFRHEEGGKKNLVVVPFSTVKELDSMKNQLFSAGAEDALKYLKSLKISSEAKDGIATFSMPEEGLDLAMVHDETSAEDAASIKTLEDRIRTVFSLPEKTEQKIITNKETYHIRFKGTGIIVEDPKFLQVSEDIVNEGIIVGDVELYTALQDANGSIPLQAAMDIMGRNIEGGRKLYPNQFIYLMNAEGRISDTAIVTGDSKFNHSHTRIVEVLNPRVEKLPQQGKDRKLQVGNYFMKDVLGIKPRDLEQYLSFQYGILDPNIQLFFLCGSQGSGKTLLSYVGAIDQVIVYNQEQRTLRGNDPNKKAGFYEHLILLKPNEILGGTRREVGFLPGSLYDKIKPHLAPYIDAHRESVLGKDIPFEDMLKHPKFHTDFGPPRNKESGEHPINGCAHLPAYSEVMELTYSGFMRGRSFSNSLLIVDEAQNYTPYELKTILERMGEGCKAIVMGDPAQVDNPLCSRGVNGLTHAINHYLDRPYSALVNLSKNYRSQVSDDAKEMKVFSS